MRNRTVLIITAITLPISIICNVLTVMDLCKKSKRAGGFKQLINYNWNS